jgi:peptidoglycan hydrolase-like protein with peptidoglycan-binding domain
MGDIWLHRLPEFFDRWGVRYRLADGWEKRARTSGGFTSIKGVNVHHDASTPGSTLAGALKYATVTAAVKPIGNGTITRDKDGPLVLLWAAGAANTSGKGGPRLSSRGLIPLDAANSCVVSFEAQNNGTTEPWSDDMLDLYVRACAATLDWANTITPGAKLGPGDVFAHFEWAPGRKIDPAGPSRFTGGKARTMFDMDQFRGEVFKLMVAGPPVAHAPQPAPGAEPVTAHVVVAGDTWLSVSQRLGYSISELQAINGPTLEPGKVIMTTAAIEPHPDHLVPYAAGTPQPVIRPGDSGPAVSNLIDVLKFWGWYPVPDDVNDGRYGDRVVQGVANAQLALKVVGLLGTWDAPTARAYSDHLYAMQGLTCPLPATSGVGDSGQKVIDLQTYLTSCGWYGVRIDGQYGPRTAQAVQLAQRYVKGLRYYDGPIHGVFDGPTRDAICRAL